MSERLTEERLAEKYKSGYYGDLQHLDKIYIKLSEFEDFMEENKFDSLAQLNEYISNLQDLTDCSCYVDDLKKENKKLEQENQAYKKRWERLKEYIANQIMVDKQLAKSDKSEDFEAYAIAEEDILWKMQELEEGGDETK